ncbi:hypothetical protein BC832DRAFT_391198 [Gaertneriomyces semiglobifer]|nr:hypothetical protein BC832DRAFT_391198 [Gaertneriomyces semiglobifer]
MFGFAARRLPLLQPIPRTVRSQSPVAFRRLQSTDAGRYSAGEVRQRLLQDRGDETIVVDIKDKQEVGQTGFLDMSYRMKKSDLAEALAKTEEAGPAVQPRFEYRSDRLECYVNSPRSSVLIGELAKRGTQSEGNIENAFSDNGTDLTAANSGASRTSKSKQPVDL